MIILPMLTKQDVLVVDVAANFLTNCTERRSLVTFHDVVASSFLSNG